MPQHLDIKPVIRKKVALDVEKFQKATPTATFSLLLPFILTLSSLQYGYAYLPVFLVGALASFLLYKKDLYSTALNPLISTYFQTGLLIISIYISSTLLSSHIENIPFWAVFSVLFIVVFSLRKITIPEIPAKLLLVLCFFFATNLYLSNFSAQSLGQISAPTNPLLILAILGSFLPFFQTKIKSNPLPGLLVVTLLALSFGSNSLSTLHPLLGDLGSIVMTIFFLFFAFTTAHSTVETIKFRPSLVILVLFIGIISNELDISPLTLATYFSASTILLTLVSKASQLPLSSITKSQSV